MPEIPDIEAYLGCLEERIGGQRLVRIRLESPFLLRSTSPSVEEMEGGIVEGLRRLGKRIVIGLDGERFLVVHLMIAGRLRWRERGAKLPGKIGLAAFDFDSGTLLLTEAGSKKRASLHLVRGEDALREHDPGGVEPLETDRNGFGAALVRESHTLMTCPRLSYHLLC